MKIRGDYSVLIAIMAIMLVFIVLSLRLEFFAVKRIPLLVAGSTFILAAIGLAKEILARDKPEISNTGAETSRGEGIRERWGLYVVIGALGVALYLTLYLLGFFIAIPLFILSAMKLGGTRWWVAAILAILVTAFIYGLFDVILEVDLYQGLVFSRR